MILLYSLLGVFIPFLGTCLGSLLVFFYKKGLNSKYQKMMIGFAIGVMLAASIWSLIIPSLELSKSFKSFSWIPTVIGLLFGVLFLNVISKSSKKFEKYYDENCINMLFFSVTLHNIPEGMAVGVCFAGVLSGNVDVSLLSAIVLAVGIAIQNIPEGAILSMPMYLKGASKKKSFMFGLLSGVVEPIFALVTIALTKFVVPVLPYLLSFAAGAMIYVIFEELVNEMNDLNNSKVGTFSIIFGFIIMMVLDIVLG